MAVISYKCSACGGPLKWDAAKQKYFCEYCRTEYVESELEKAEAMQQEAKEVSTEEAVHLGQKPASGADTVNVYNCPSCGAQIITEPSTTASFCYYCHNPIVLSDKMKGSFHPDAVIPFAIDQKKAKEIFTDWVGKHRYVPQDFYSEEQIEKLSGVYFPYWVYNAVLHGRAKGVGEKDSTSVRGNEQITETEVYEINKDGDMPIKDISRIALKKASKVLCESVAPFDREKARPFSYGYLSGFVAEGRDVGKEELADEVHNEIRTFAEDSLRAESQGAYHRVNLSELSVKLKSEDWKYVLMPVWTLTYKGNDGKTYFFSINGESGKTVGELPVDKKSLVKLFLMVFIPVLIVLILLFHFLG